MHAAKNSMRSGNCITMQIRLPPAINRARNFIFHRISTPWSFSHSRSSLVRAFSFSRASAVGIIDIHFDIHRKSLLDTSPLSRRYLRIISSLRFPFIFFFMRSIIMLRQKNQSIGPSRPRWCICLPLESGIKNFRYPTSCQVRLGLPQ